MLLCVPCCPAINDIQTHDRMNGMVILGDFMKGINFFAALLLAAMLPMLAHAQTTTSGSGALSIVNLYVTPQPIVAGDNITIKFQLYNSYPNVLNNVNLQLSGAYPLLNYSPSQTTLINSMGTGLYNGLYSYFTYNIKIPKYAKSGTYTLDVIAEYMTTSTTTEGTSTLSTTVTQTAVMPITLYISGTPDIRLTPLPEQALTPGSQSDVTIEATNIGTGSADNVSVELLDSKNFTITGPYIFYMSNIDAGSTGTASAEIYVNSSIGNGKEAIPAILRYNLDSGQGEAENVSMPISIAVQSPSLVATVAGATPPYIYPGTNQTLSISIHNSGNGEAKNATITFLNASGLSLGNSASSTYLGSINEGASVMQNVFISAYKSDNASMYYLPIRLQYYNANMGNETDAIEYVPVRMQSAAVFNITEELGSLNPGNTYVPVTFRIKNTGNQAAQNLNLDLQTIYPVSTSNGNAYIDSLAPGEAENVTFYVNIDPQGNPGQYPVTIYEQWTQPNGATSQQYSSSDNYYVEVGAATSSQGAPPWEEIVGAIAVIAVVAAAYRRTRKKGDKARSTKK